jgi:Mn2+/Fe2+ NRAMP family transporter
MILQAFPSVFLIVFVQSLSWKIVILTGMSHDDATSEAFVLICVLSCWAQGKSLCCVSACRSCHRAVRR